MIQGPWERTTSRVKWLRGCTIITDCCACRMPARDTEIRVDIVDPKSHFAPYYGPTRHFRCAEDAGCNVAPWKRCGKEAREGWIEALFDGPAPFIRVRTGQRLGFAE